MSTVQPCTHCGTPMEVPPGHAPGAPLYCCHGCQLAAEIIAEAGLDRYYDEREAEANRPVAPPSAGWDRVERRELPDGTVEADLCIDGLNCAACVWVTERVMERTAGVVDAHVSYATGRSTVRWNPEDVELDAVLGKVSALGYRPRALDVEASPDRDLMLRLGMAIFGMMNIMLLATSVYLGWLQGMDPLYQALFRWTSLLLATPVALWSAAPFFRGAVNGLRMGVLHMDLPVSIGIAVAYGHGLLATFAREDGYFDSLTMLVTLLLVGRILEQRGRRRAADAATALAAQAPRVARVETEDGLVEVDPADLGVGDRIRVAAGEEVAADGVVVQGKGRVQMALLTGESEAVAVAGGDAVVTGGVLEDGSLLVEVSARADESVLARMAAGLRDAADRPVDPSLADRIAPWFTAITLVVATLGTGGWWWLTDRATALSVGIAVLVVACPCALSLARPLALSAGLGAAARRGLLFRSGDALLRLAEADTVVLDKTGTVTGGRPVVVEAEDEVLRVAAGIERASIHPVARAIVDEAVARGIALPFATDIEETAGEGIVGVVDGQRWSVRSGGAGRVGLYDAAGTERGLILLRDTVRSDAARSIAALQQRGLDVVLLTGDHPAVAHAIARQAGIPTVLAGCRPDDKAAWIERARAEGQRVLFVGDGLNDGPALAAADVGIAMGSGAASSVLVADAVVATAALGPVVAGLRAAHEARDAVARNIRRSILYNIVAVSGALLGLVNPLVAAILMPLSSALVIAGALSVERAVGREEQRSPVVSPPLGLGDDAAALAAR